MYANLTRTYARSDPKVCPQGDEKDRRPKAVLGICVTRKEKKKMSNYKKVSAICGCGKQYETFWGKTCPDCLDKRKREREKDRWYNVRKKAYHEDKLPFVTVKCPVCEQFYQVQMRSPRPGFIPRIAHEEGHCAMLRHAYRYDGMCTGMAARY